LLTFSIASIHLTTGADLRPIKDHKPGYRALFGHFAAATSSAKQCLPPAVSLLPKLYWNDSLEIKPTAERWIRRTLQFGWEVVEFPGKIRQTDGLFGLAVVAGQISRRDRYSCHANQGLNDYTRDVARRLAKQGYVTLAVDYLSRHSGTQKANPNGEGLSNIRELEPWQAVAEDTDGGYSYLKTLPTVRSDRLGLVGFCWGGEMTFASPTEVRRLEAVVVFLRTPTAAGAAGKNSGARALPLR